jgi:magnesium-transporting ATPase (P-type)
LIAAEARLLADGPHALSIADVCRALATSPAGLTSTEVRARRDRFGRNELPESKAPGPLRVLLRQFSNPLVYILFVAAAISAAMRDWSDAAFILAVLSINAIIGCVQEFSAEKSARALQALSITKAYVVRDGEDHEVDATELVPGDAVLLEAGNKVPADVRLVGHSGIEVDESLLTGESLTSTKTPAPVHATATPVGDRANMAFAATLVTRGRAQGIVVATGTSTQIGRIASSLVASDTAKPPLLVRMERFTSRIAMGVTVAVVVLGAVSVARGSSVPDVFLLAVALAVSAIPEGLPVALTVALSIGARRMARRKVIARRLVAVEALGSCTFIASDKTGTLTMNELTARRIVLPTGGEGEVTGHGVTPEGEVRVADADLALVERLAIAAVLCNDGFLGQRDDAWVHHGDAVDVALLAMAAKLGIGRAAVESASPRIFQIPFEPEHRFAATFHRVGEALHVSVKGANERVLAMCTRMAARDADVSIERAALEERADRLGSAGFRVLAFAAGEIEAAGREASDIAPHELNGLVFLGFVAMIDPLRPEAKAAVVACQRAGIQVAMVTGDHPVTALAISRELGLADRSEQVVTGPVLARLASQGLPAMDAVVREARVFARVDPTQKLQIVQSLIRLGHFVAVTGDGANDAPALRAAHIGVAMGERGTDVARESAELILTDDNFASIAAGIEEGRIAYGNVRKVIFLLVSSGAAEVLLFVMTIAAGLPAPLWPVQLLWLNLVTNGIQDVALAFEPAEGGELERPPRAPREPIFDRLMVERIVVTALVISVVGFFVYRWMLLQGWSVAMAQNGLLLLLVLFENVQAGNSRSETASLFTSSPLRNRVLLGGTIVAQLVHIAAMYTPGLRDVLHIQPISLDQWLVLLCLACMLFVVAELHKLIIRRRRLRRGVS